MVAHWRNSTAFIAAGTCTCSAGTAAQSCVPSPFAATHVCDRGTPLMMRSFAPLCSLHGGSTACRGLRHLALWHGHRYHVVSSSCLLQRGHASRRGCHIPRCSGTSSFPVSGDSRRSCSIRGWRACGGLHLPGACMHHSMSAELWAVGRAPYVAGSGSGTAKCYPLGLLATAFVACASCRMLPIFRTSP